MVPFFTKTIDIRLSLYPLPNFFAQSTQFQNTPFLGGQWSGEGQILSRHFQQAQALIGGQRFDIFFIDFLQVIRHTISFPGFTGTSGTLRSLHQFALAKGTRLAVRFDLNPPTVQSIRHQVSGTRQRVEMTLLSLPLYLVGQLGRLLDRLRQEH